MNSDKKNELQGRDELAEGANTSAQRADSCTSAPNPAKADEGRGAFGFGICPVCSGALFEIRGKLQCRVCHTICETCCEGGRQ